MKLVIGNMSRLFIVGFGNFLHPRADVSTQQLAQWINDRLIPYLHAVSNVCNGVFDQFTAVAAGEKPTLLRLGAYDAAKRKTFGTVTEWTKACEGSCVMCER